MWHEARKHEKKIRVMIVDYRRRAERRREFYEKFKADPAQFIQLHGRPCKIYMDSQITAAAENSLMPWQGNKDITIDRFDVRAHLDIIPEATGTHDEPSQDEIQEEVEDPSLNYERYRILVQNDLAGISEDKFLHQIHVEEQFGTATPHSSKAFDSKPKLPKAAIAYSYEDSTPAGISHPISKPLASVDNPDEDSDEDVDFDLLVNVNDLTIAQKAELNNNGIKYGLGVGEFMSYLDQDAQERDDIRLAKLEAEEKLTMSGRKARRERRAFKDKIIVRKTLLSPPSYAAAPEEEDRRSSSRSNSPSGSNSPEKVTFITCFGGSEAVGDNGKGEMGPSLPPGGLPTKNRWRRNRSRTRSRSPNLRKMSSKTRSRSRSPRDLSDRRSRHPVNRDRRRSSRSRSGSSRAGRLRHSDRKGYSRRRSSSSRSSHSRSERRRRRSDSRSKYQRKRTRSRSSSSDRRYNSRRTRNSRSNRRSRSNSRTRSSRRSNSPRNAKKSASSSRRKARSSSSSSHSSSSEHRRVRVTAPAGAGKEEAQKSNGNSLPQAQEVSESLPVVRLPSPPVRRYYGRQPRERHRESSGSISLSASSDSDSVDESAGRNSGLGRNSDKPGSSTSHMGLKSKSSVSTSSKHSSALSTQDSSSSSAKLTPQERLKRRMQSALNKQLKADKEAERMRIERLEQERLDREDTLRELSIKYRRREREKRHNTAATSDSESDSYRSNASAYNRSRSGSPCMEF